jgi:ectoine hydroxylase-related dioxygenase (phytanoyl-CoA dioxygenase family)
MTITPDLRAGWDNDGYCVVRGLFSADECAALRDHYMTLRAEGPKPGDSAGIDIGSADPLKRYPRMIHMHHWDARSLRWMTDARLNHVMTGLLGRAPLAVQTMLYFKPPGARGQAMHQDNFYLKVRPGTCLAAWMALDASDEANGCMQVSPGTHRLPILCTKTADVAASFTDVTVPVPPHLKVVPVPMAAGDVLFFHGNLIHGSFPNTTKDRFRRSLIGHYVMAEAEVVSKHVHPVYRMDGTTVDTVGKSEAGGPCGVWTDLDDAPAVEMVEAAAGPDVTE